MTPRAPQPVRYRWDVYGDRTRPGPWYLVRSWARMNRAVRSLKMPNERIRVELDNGQQVVVRARFGPRRSRP